MLCPYTLLLVKCVFQLFVRLSGTCLKHFTRFYSSLACCVSHNEIPRMHWQPQSLLLPPNLPMLQFTKKFPPILSMIFSSFLSSHWRAPPSPAPRNNVLSVKENCSAQTDGWDPQLQVGLIVVSNLPAKHKIRLLSQNRSNRSNLTPPQKGRFDMIKILWHLTVHVMTALTEAVALNGEAEERKKERTKNKETEPNVVKFTSTAVSVTSPPPPQPPTPHPSPLLPPPLLPPLNQSFFAPSFILSLWGNIPCLPPDLKV